MSPHVRRPRLTSQTALRSLLLLLVAVFSAPTGAVAQTPAQIGRGYVFGSLHGDIPVGAVRGLYPGSTQDVLFVVTNPTPDSTALFAFQAGRLVQRLSVPLAADYEFRDADIPNLRPDAPPTAKVYASFEFDGPQVAVNVLWNHNVNRWAFVASAKADGSREGGGDLDWFSPEITEAIYPNGIREGGLPARARDRDTRRIAMTGGASLRVERASYREVPDAHYTIGVYDGDVGPVQLMEGVAATSAADLDTESAQSCSGLPAVVDVNGDGYEDFWLCDAEGANGFQSGAYRLFDPEAGLFVKDLRFSFYGHHTFDARTRTRTLREGRWATAGQYQTHSTYDLSSGLPVLVEQRVQEPEDERCGWGTECRMRVYTRVWEGRDVRVTEARLGSGADYTLPLDFGTSLPPAVPGDALTGLPSNRRSISPDRSLYAYIRQGDRVFPLAPHPEFPASITLADGPFTIEVPGVPPDRGVAVCATSTDRTWDLEVGGQVQAHSCFGLGSGMAIGPVRGRYAFPLMVVDGGGFSPFVPDRRRPNGTTALVEIDRIEFRDGDMEGDVHLIVLAGEASTLRAGDAWTAILRRD